MTLSMGVKVGSPLDPGPRRAPAGSGGVRGGAPLRWPLVPVARGAGTAGRALGMAARARRRSADVSDSPLVRLAILFGSLSLVSFGGGNTVIPAMHREAVGAALAHRPAVRRPVRARPGGAGSELAHREPDRLRRLRHPGCPGGDRCDVAAEHAPCVRGVQRLGAPARHEVADRDPARSPRAGHGGARLRQRASPSRAPRTTGSAATCSRPWRRSSWCARV